MCGFVGMLGAVTPDRIRNANDLIRHRGPDDEGYYNDGRISLGFRRLSIIDLSKAGHQPMSNEDGTIWIVYNGEVYNYVEIREDLKNHVFKSRTDTEVVLHAYEEWGEECLKRFNGMFAFAIWDTRKKKLFCARDRFGIKPFYYYKGNGFFIFSSEIKPILELGPRPVPNDAVIYDYLAYGLYDHTEETFFKGVNKLKAGNYLVCEKGKACERPYWLVENDLECLDSFSEQDILERFGDLLRDSVRLRLRSDVEVGVNLSGGLDSSSLLATIKEIAPSWDYIKAFSVGYEDKRFDEHSYIDKVVKKLKCRNYYHKLSADEVWGAINKVSRHLEEPFGGIPTLSYFFTFKMAKEKGAVVLLEGQGTDESMAGYDYFYPYFLADTMKDAGRKRYLEESGMLAANGFNVAEEKVREILKGKDFTYTPSKHFLKGSFHKRFSGRRPVFKRPLGGYLSNRLYIDLYHAKLPRVLRFNDKLSMAFSKELREPFLDYRLVRFLFSLPNKYKVRGGINKYILRKCISGKVPEPVRMRLKNQLVTPQTEWLKNELRRKAANILSSESLKARGYFEVAAIGEELKDFLNPGVKCANSFYIWQMVNLELWFRTFIDREAD